MSNIIKESEIRTAVRKLFEMDGHDGSVIKVNDVVDQSAALTDPGNANYKPNSRAELSVALRTLIDDLPDENISNVYDRIKHALETQDETGEEEMTKANSKIKNVEEAAIRKAVRNIIRSEVLKEDWKEDKAKKLWANMPPPVGDLPPVQKIPPGVSGSGRDERYKKNVSALQKTFKTMNMAEYEPEGSEELAGRKNTMVSDVGGSSFKEIAAELGFAHESGAKQAVEKALSKMRTRLAMDPDDLEIATLTAMNDYIEELQSSGELTAADIQLLKDHPNIVGELEGFREFLSSQLKKAEKSR
jgi:hypothetical protein